MMKTPESVVALSVMTWLYGFGPSGCWGRSARDDSPGDAPCPAGRVGLGCCAARLADTARARTHESDGASRMDGPQEMRRHRDTNRREAKRREASRQEAGRQRYVLFLDALYLDVLFLDGVVVVSPA